MTFEMTVAGLFTPMAAAARVPDREARNASSGLALDVGFAPEGVCRSVDDPVTGIKSCEDTEGGLGDAFSACGGEGSNADTSTGSSVADTVGEGSVRTGAVLVDDPGLAGSG
jgi:hypothetical protein